MRHGKMVIKSKGKTSMNIVKEIKAQGPYIRFELGLESLTEEAYRNESLRRVSAIYHTIFEPEDDVIFIHRTEVNSG
ncbi:hypothetical protein EV294_102672 [Paenibacillus sp. BK033]|uniref:DUF3885 domain-containing protein n=1 Tax=Paenibacillus sp. BK033 TaxID=2512133 RepID=UPI001047BAAF|nr:hypothetical protein [Paenibacillus sp. BK033]TCM99376.1 hypothetical protein EV294_102672 [Paenibacillus sp. BK033]